MTDAERCLDMGDKFPYDAPDSFWEYEGETNIPPAPKHWAHRAARGVIADLQDRRSIKNGFDDIDELTRAEIVESLTEIIKQAWKE